MSWSWSCMYNSSLSSTSTSRELLIIFSFIGLLLGILSYNVKNIQELLVTLTATLMGVVLDEALRKCSKLWLNEKTRQNEVLREQFVLAEAAPLTPQEEIQTNEFPGSSSPPFLCENCARTCLSVQNQETAGSWDDEIFVTAVQSLDSSPVKESPINIRI